MRLGCRNMSTAVRFRLTRRSILVLLGVVTILSLGSYWSHSAGEVVPEPKRNVAVQKAPPIGVGGDFDSDHFLNRNAKNYNMPVEMDIPAPASAPSSMQEIECDINKQYTIQCRREDQEVYMPVSFIKKHFEVYGEISNEDGEEKFMFSNSYSQAYPPPRVIRPDGMFMSFEHYNVEVRKRVMCITATEGVPMSTQWEPAGHYYPIQIAQFGLSHYSKYLREGEPDSETILSGTSEEMEEWTIPRRARAQRVWDKTQESYVMEFETSDSLSTEGVHRDLDETSNFALSFDLRIISKNGSVSVKIRNNDVVYDIHYVFSNTLISCDGAHIYYGLGESQRGKWIHFAHDTDMQLLKGLALKCSKHRKIRDLTLLGITVRGEGWIDNVTLLSAVHMDHFYSAATWFVSHQDSRGGWPIMVKRKLISGVMELPPGWYSAMAQGHAMSTLVRAYLKTKDSVYLKAAINGLKVFEISSAQGGVKARFMDTHDWYEEYPTTPSSFVLNGFIYSLFGLYDLKQVTTGKDLVKVTRLYDTGMKSLKAMLLMFDAGVGTFYDLRHVSIGMAPNRARWDYHTTHISQLLQLSKMDSDPIFSETAKRWSGYLTGKWAPHN